MPTLLSVVILMAALYCFWLFAQTATPRQMGRLLLVLAVVISTCVLLFLALTARLPLALIVLMALWPIMAGIFDKRRQRVIRMHGKLNDPYAIDHVYADDNTEPVNHDVKVTYDIKSHFNEKSS